MKSGIQPESRGKTWLMGTPVVAALVLLCVASGPAICAYAADNTPNPRTIEVTGNGEIQAAPDLATLNVAIETHGPTAAEAAARNGVLAQKVSAALKAKLADKGKTWTGGYSLQPEYNSPRDNQRPQVTGYSAQNSITVETGELDLMGPLIDAAIAAGANQINSLDFSLRDDGKARSQAIAKAAADAQAQAAALANALGVKLGPVLTASTVAQVRPVPVFAARMSMAASAATPVQAGEVTIPATVSLSYGIE